MSPCETSNERGWLEHPAEAFAYYRGQGPRSHLRGEAHGVAGRRHRLPGRTGGRGTTSESPRVKVGIVCTRTGRRFFNEPELERRFIDGCGRL